MQMKKAPKVGRDMGGTGRDKSLGVRSQIRLGLCATCVTFHMPKAKTILIMVLQPLYVTVK